MPQIIDASVGETFSVRYEPDGDRVLMKDTGNTIQITLRRTWDDGFVSNATMSAAFAGADGNPVLLGAEFDSYLEWVRNSGVGDERTFSFGSEGSGYDPEIISQYNSRSFRDEWSAAAPGPTDLCITFGSFHGLVDEACFPAEIAIPSGAPIRQNISIESIDVAVENGQATAVVGVSNPVPNAERYPLSLTYLFDGEVIGTATGEPTLTGSQRGYNAETTEVTFEPVAVSGTSASGEITVTATGTAEWIVGEETKSVTVFDPSILDTAEVTIGSCGYRGDSVAVGESATAFARVNNPLDRTIVADVALSAGGSRDVATVQVPPGEGREATATFTFPSPTPGGYPLTTEIVGVAP